MYGRTNEGRKEGRKRERERASTGLAKLQSILDAGILTFVSLTEQDETLGEKSMMSLSVALASRSAAQDSWQALLL